jgi:hypothetical protein
LFFFVFLYCYQGHSPAAPSATLAAPGRPYLSTAGAPVAAARVAAHWRSSPWLLWWGPVPRPRCDGGSWPESQSGVGGGTGRGREVGGCQAAAPLFLAGAGAGTMDSSRDLLFAGSPMVSGKRGGSSITVLIGMPSLLSEMHFFHTQRSLFRSIEINFLPSWPLNLLSSDKMLNLKLFINSIDCAKFANFPWSFCTCFNVHVRLCRKKSIVSWRESSFSFEMDHSIATLSNCIPSTVPYVLGPKAFSWFLQFSANGMSNFLHMSL